MIEFTPIHDLIGVHIPSVDVTELDDDELTLVREAAARHGFVLFKQQSLDPANMVALARRFGEPLPGYRPEFTHPDYAELVMLGNIPEGDEIVTYLNTQGVEWHSDSTGSVLPPNVSMLYAVETPDVGGDTLFANAVVAYRELDESARQILDGLFVVHSFDYHNDQVATYDKTNVRPRDDSLREKNPDKTEALVQTHPITGERHFHLSHQMVKEVVGMSQEQGTALVMQLVEHMTQPDRVYRHHWSPGDLIVFDNRTAVHSATEYDYQDERRLMYQIIVGDMANPTIA